MSIGQVVEVDYKGLTSDQARFLRIRVEIPLNKLLRRGTQFKNPEGEPRDRRRRSSQPHRRPKPLASLASLFWPPQPSHSPPSARSPHRCYRTCCRSVEIGIHSNGKSLRLENLEVADHRFLLQRPKNIVSAKNSSVGNDSVGGRIERIWLGFPLTLRIRDFLPAMVIADGNFVGIGFESSVIVFHGRESFGDCLVAEKALGKKVSNLTLLWN
nr:hypothetical protein CFP56_16138 [Quercus suber]